MTDQDGIIIKMDIVIVLTSRYRVIVQGSCLAALMVALSLAGFPSLAAQTTKAGQTPSHASSDTQIDALYQRGMQLLREKRYDDALRQFELVEEKAPQSPQGPNGRGIALALMGQPGDAIQALKKALEIDPNFWVARRELGIVYWSQGLKKQASEELTPVIRLHPDDAPVNVILGQYHFESNDYSQALACLSHVPGQVSADPRLSLIQAEAQLKTGQASAAGKMLSGLVGRAGLTDEQKFQLGWLLGQTRLFKKAIEVFRELPPGSPDFRRNYGLALAYFGDGQYERCTATLKDLLVRGSTRPEGFSLLGVAEEKSGHTREAYDAFRQGILKNPNDAQSYLNIATLSCEHLNYDLAVQILTSGIERIPDSHELFLSRGIAYTLKGQFDLARRDYDSAIGMAPDDPGAYAALGVSQLEAGNLEGAISAFEEASGRGPMDPHPHYFLAEALMQKGATPGTPSFDQALRALETALSLDPNFAYAYLDRAKLELKAGQQQKAIADLERARAADPKSGAIGYLLAQAYQRNGERAKADELFARIAKSSRQEALQFRRNSLTQALVVISRGDR